MKKYIIIIFLLKSLIIIGQDMEYARNIVEKLSSEKFYGRGYINKGDSIAAQYLKNEFKNIGLQKIGESYLQKYTFSVNSIPENPVLIFGDNQLAPAKDFIVIPSSPDIDEWVKICWINKNTFLNPWRFNNFLKSDKSECLVCIDTTGFNNPELYSFANLFLSKKYIEAKGIIEVATDLKYTARTYIDDIVHIQIKPDVIDVNADSVYLKISNEFYENYKTQNVVGYLEGETDSIIMVVAHYDHLGMLGDIMFPGANDNASGVSMVLNLAKYYKKNENNLKHNIFFVLFSGEEADLSGSTYFANNPPFDLSLVKVVINFDMVGTGTHGISVFNAKEYPEYEEILFSLNDEKKYFERIRTTEAVYSSDHAPFHEKGVKAMFFFAGDNSYYHQPEDVPEDLTFKAYKGLFNIIIDFIEKM